MKLSPRRVLVFALCLIVISSPARAAVREADATVVTGECRRMLNTLPYLNGSLPYYLVSDHDVYLCIISGAAYIKVKVVARPSVDSKRLARALDGAVQSTWMRGEAVEWSHDTYSAAQVEADRNVPGKLYSHIDIPLAALVNGLQVAGFAPHTILTVPHYAALSPRVTPQYHGSERDYYAGPNLSALPHVSVAASIPVWTLGLLVAVWAFGPIVLIVAQRQACREVSKVGTDVKAARKKFNDTAIVPGFALANLSLVPILVSQIGPGVPIPDLWFATTKLTPLMPMALLVLLPMMLVSLRSVKIADSIFGPGSEAAAKKAMPESERPVRRWQSVADGTGIAAPFLLIAAPCFPHIASALFHAVLSMLGLAAIGVSESCKWNVRRLTRQTVDHDLTFRAQQFARRLDATIDRVRIDTSGIGMTRAFYEREGADIVLSGMLRDQASDSEMDFILASAAAYPPARTKWYMHWPALYLAVPPFVVAYGYYAFYFRLPITSTPRLFELAILCFAGLIFILPQAYRMASLALLNQEIKGDEAALNLLQNPDPAISVIERLKANPPDTPSPGFNKITVEKRLETRSEKLRAMVATARPIRPERMPI